MTGSGWLRSERKLLRSVEHCPDAGLESPERRADLVVSPAVFRLGSLERSFDRAQDWYVDPAHGGDFRGVEDPARIVIPVQVGVSLRINDAGEDGILYELIAGSRSESLGEFSGHSRLPLLRHREAVRLAEVCAAPPQVVGWRKAMATALVIGGSWDGPPSAEGQREVSAMWSSTGMVSDRSGADRLVSVWGEKVAWESQTSKGRGDPFGLENQPDVISGVRLSKLSPTDRLLARALGWAQP